MVLSSQPASQFSRASKCISITSTDVQPNSKGCWLGWNTPGDGFGLLYTFLLVNGRQENCSRLDHSLANDVVEQQIGRWDFCVYLGETAEKRFFCPGNTCCSQQMQLYYHVLEIAKETNHFEFDVKAVHWREGDDSLPGAIFHSLLVGPRCNATCQNCVRALRACSRSIQIKFKRCQTTL